MRCPSAKLIGPAWIDGYRFCWRTWGDIELADDNYTIGLLWELDDAALDSLDQYEGFPTKYFRQRVIARTSQNEYVSWAYMMVDQGSESQPYDEYRSALFEGYDENGLSTEQMELGLKRLDG